MPSQEMNKCKQNHELLPCLVCNSERAWSDRGLMSDLNGNGWLRISGLEHKPLNQGLTYEALTK